MANTVPMRLLVLFLLIAGTVCYPAQAQLSNAVLENVVIVDNVATNSGGGLYLDSSSVRIINSTIANNEAGLVGGGVAVSSNATPIIRNVILWGNRAWTNVNIHGDGDASPDIRFSDIQQSGYDGINSNITADPLFLRQGNYHLHDASPVIGKGDSGSAPVEDRDGVRRGTQVDLGAYEHASPVRTLYVNSVLGSDDNDGLFAEPEGALSGPMRTIQSAVDTAQSGDSLIVAAGRYAGEGNRDIDFNGKDIALRSVAGDKLTIIDCEGAGRAFHFHNKESEKASVEGFTITGGHVEGPYPYGSGGGILVADSSPTIRNCTLVGNRADWGGGVEWAHAGGSMVNCVINGNEAPVGGGMYIVGVGTTRVVNCTIAGNGGTNGQIRAEGARTALINCIAETVAEGAGGNRLEVSHSFVSGGYVGQGNLGTGWTSADALFLCHRNLAGPCSTGVVYDAVAGTSTLSVGQDARLMASQFGRSLQVSTNILQYFIVGNTTNTVTVIGDLRNVVSSGNTLALHDYHLTYDAPAIDVGLASDAPPLDKDGSGRYEHPLMPNALDAGNPPVDMGAYEFNPVNNPPSGWGCILTLVVGSGYADYVLYDVSRAPVQGASGRVVSGTSAAKTIPAGLYHLAYSMNSNPAQYEREVWVSDDTTVTLTPQYLLTLMADSGHTATYRIVQTNGASILGAAGVITQGASRSQTLGQSCYSILYTLTGDAKEYQQTVQLNQDTNLHLRVVCTLTLNTDKDTTAAFTFNNQSNTPNFERIGSLAAGTNSSFQLISGDYSLRYTVNGMPKVEEMSLSIAADMAVSLYSRRTLTIRTTDSFARYSVCTPAGAWIAGADGVLSANASAVHLMPVGLYVIHFSLNGRYSSYCMPVQLDQDRDVKLEERQSGIVVRGLDTRERYSVDVQHDPFGETESFPVWEGEPVVLTNHEASIGGMESRTVALQTWEGWELTSFTPAGFAAASGVATEGNHINVRGLYEGSVKLTVSGLDSRERFLVDVRHDPFGETESFPAWEGEQVVLTNHEALIEGANSRTVELQTWEGWDLTGFTPAGFTTARGLATDGNHIAVLGQHEGNARITFTGLDTRERFLIDVRHMPFNVLETVAINEGESALFNRGVAAISGNDPRTISLKAYDSWLFNGFVPQAITGECYNADAANRFSVSGLYQGGVSSEIGGLDTYQRYMVNVVHLPMQATDTFYAVEAETATFANGVAFLAGSNSRQYELRNFEPYICSNYNPSVVIISDAVADAGHRIICVAQWSAQDSGSTGTVSSLTTNYQASVIFHGLDTRERYLVDMVYLPFGSSGRFVVWEDEPVVMTNNEAVIGGLDARIMPLLARSGWASTEFLPSVFTGSTVWASTANHISVTGRYDGVAMVSLGGLDTYERYVVKLTHKPFDETDSFYAFEQEAIHFSCGQAEITQGAVPRTVTLTTFPSWSFMGFNQDGGTTMADTLDVEVGTAIGSNNVILAYAWHGGTAVTIAGGLDTRNRYQVEVQHTRDGQVARSDRFHATEGDAVALDPKQAIVTGDTVQVFELSKYQDATGFNYALSGLVSTGASLSFVASDDYANVVSNNIPVACIYDYLDVGAPVIVHGLDTYKRYVYDLTATGRTPDRDFSVINLNYSTQVETASRHRFLENILLRNQNPALPLSSPITLPAHPFVGQLVGNAEILYVGVLLDGSLNGRFCDPAPRLPGAYKYRIYTRLSDPALPTYVFNPDEASIDSANMTVNGLHATNDLDVLPPVQAILTATAADSGAVLTWTYPDVSAGVDADADVHHAVLTYSPSSSTGTVNSIAVGNTRWYSVGNLTNGISYTFSLITYDIAMNSSTSAPVSVTPMRESTGLYDVTDLSGAASSDRAFLRWRYDAGDSRLIAADAIGFLVHRDNGGHPELIAALPLRDGASRVFNSYTDAGLQAGQAYSYTVSVIDKLNRRSSGAGIRIVTQDPTCVASALGLIQARFAVGEALPGFANSGASWTGSELGAIPGWGKQALLPVGTGAEVDGSNVAYRIPARDSDNQFFQTLLPQNNVLSLHFGLQITGDDLFNSGVTVLKFKTLDDTTSAGSIARVWPVRLMQDRILVGDYEARFYHGGEAHRYTITKVYDEVRLFVDGHELTLTRIAGAANTSAESGNAFVRFGAKSSNTQMATRWTALAVLPGVADYFPKGEALCDTTAPGAVSNLQVNTSVDPGKVSVSWIPPTDSDVACYRVSVSTMAGFNAYVYRASPSVALALPQGIPSRLQVQAIDFAGNLGPISESAMFIVQSPAPATGFVLHSSSDYLAAGFTITASGGLRENSGWINFRDGAVMSGSVAASVSNMWVLDMTIAISPEMIVSNGATRTEMTQADIVELDSAGSNRKLSVFPKAIYLGGDKIADVALGGAEHRLRFINDGVGLHLGLDGMYLKTVAPISLNHLVVGDLNPLTTSKLNLKQLIVAVNGTSVTNMAPLGGSLTNQPVVELELDESRCSNSNGLTLAWHTPDEQVTLIEVEYLTERVFNGQATQVVSVLPAKYLEHGQFIASTLCRQAKDGEPGQVILKAVPYNLSGTSGMGSAKMLRYDYPRSGGTVLTNVDIVSEILTAWDSLRNVTNTNINHKTLPFPSVRVPGFKLVTGGDTNLIVTATNGASFASIAADGFELDSQMVSLTNDWSFGGYVMLGGFRGTLFAAVPAVGNPLALTYDGTNLSLGCVQSPVMSNSLHHIRLTFVKTGEPNRGVASLYLDNSSIPVRSNLVVNAGFDAASVMRFGNLAYTGGCDRVESGIAPASQLKPLAWTQVEVGTMGAGSNFAAVVDGAPVTSVWHYVSGVAVASPDPQLEPSLGAVYLEALGQSVDLSYGDGTTLSNCWSMQFMANAINGTTCFIFNSDTDSITVSPQESHWTMYRVTHTPERTRLFANGQDITESTMLSRSARNINDRFSLRIIANSGARIAFKNLVMVNNAVDDLSGIFTPVHGLFYAELAHTNDAGVALSDSSVALFGDTALSVPSSDTTWVFDSLHTNDVTSFTREAQVLRVYAPGDYGVTLVDSQTNALAALSHVQLRPRWQTSDVAALSGGLISTQSEFDTHSVILVPHQRPAITVEGGDRRVDLTLDNQPDDLQGYVLWQNDMGSTLGSEAVPVKFISKLGEQAIERIRKVAAASATHPFITSDQKSGLAGLPNQNLLSKSSDDLNLFFYNEDRGSFTVPVGGVKNATMAGQQYTFTFDPYDDALPHPSESVPTPNLGSRESGLNDIPATNVNTVSIGVQTANQMPVFLQSGLVVSRTPDGSPLPTIRDINTNVAAWIQNNVDPDLVVVPGSWANTRLYFSGPLAADRTMSAGDVSIEGAGGAENQVADFSTTIDTDHADQPAVSDPFYYNKDMRRIELPMTGSFMVGETLQNGDNQFRCTASDSDGGTAAINAVIVVSKDGARTLSSYSSIFFDRTGPIIHMQSPGKVVMGDVLVSGSYSDPSGIRRVTALLNGSSCPIDTSTASLGHGVFWFKLAQTPAQGTNDLVLVAEDLVGNVATSAVARFDFRPVTVAIRASVRKVDTNLLFSADITGLGEVGTAPALMTLALNGDPVSLTNLAFSGSTATLTNWPVSGHSGYNIFMMKAGLAVGSTGEVDATVSGSVEIYLNQADTNQLPELPQLLSVHPPVATPLYTTNGVSTFNDSQSFWVDYFDRDPGVSASNVHVLARSGSGTWQDVSDQFVFTETRAGLKSGGSFSISTNRPQIKLQVPEKNYQVPAEFSLNYTVLDKALEGQPVLLDLSQFLFARDISRTVILEGQNLAKVTEIEFRSETNGLFAQRLRILDLQTNLTKSVGSEIVTYDTLAVQVQPPLTGVAYFYLNGVRQDQTPVLIVDASSQKLIDDFVRSMRDRNGDGRIDIHDLDMNGDGLPDRSQVPIVEPAADRDGDGLPNWLDQYPDVVNSLYDPDADPLVNMACLGYTGESGGSIVVVTPEVVVHSPGVVTLYGDTLDLVGLVVPGKTRVTLQFASGLHEPVTACIEGPSGLYPSSSMDPLVFTASVALTRPPSGVDQVIVTADNGPGTPATSLSFGLQWHVNTPDITLGFAPGANPILGYHSLYNGLLVDGVMHMQSANLVEGIITHDDFVDVDSLEFRLDNEVIPRDLFETWPSSGASTKVVIFRLKDNKRIDIFNRWRGGNLSQFLSIHNLVYGPHTLGVRVQDVHKKVGTAASVFKFDHGKKLTIDVQNTVTRTDPVPSPAVPEGNAAFNAVKARTGHSLTAPRLNAGLYGVTADEGGTIDAGDFASYANYEKFVLGNDPPSGSVTGSVAVTLSGDPTYAGGALEQMLLNTQREFRVSTSLPGNFEVPFTKIESSVSGSIVTTTTKTWSYHVACSGISSQNLDVTSLYLPANDTFATNSTLLLNGMVAITLSGPTNSTSISTNSDSSSGGGGSGGGGGWPTDPGTGGGGGGGSGSGTTNPPPVVRSASLTPPPLWKMVPVGGTASLSLNIGSGTYGPTNPVERGFSSAVPCIDISGDMSKVDESGTTTLTARFPSIPGSLANPYLKLAESSDPISGMFFYDMNYRFNYKFYVEGLAIGNSLSSLTTNSAEFAFLPVSDPYAAVAVDERTLVLTHQIPGDIQSPAFLNFDFLIRDPLAFYAADPTAFPPKVAINGHWVSAADVKYISDTELPGVYKVTMSGQAIKVGENRLDFTVQNGVGSVTHASYIVELGDDDGLRIATPNDLYIDSQGARMGTIQQSKVYTQTVFGEFATPNYTITGSGALTSSMLVQRDGRFGRNARPFYIIDNYPMEGSISLPASVQGVPVAVQKPGGEVVWSTGSQNVTVYAEGVSVLSGGTPTHNLIPGDILTNSITLEAFVDAKRVASGTPSFALQIFQADGAPVELGGGLSEIVIGATDAGAIFGGRGEHFEGSTSIDIVGNLPGGVRYMVDGGVPKIVLHDGEFIEVRFAGLSTLAGALVKIDLDGDRNLNGDYTDDEVDEEKAPGLLITKTDDASSTWKDGLVKVRLKGQPGGMNAGSVVLEATVVSGGGQIKVWSTNTSPTSAALWLDTANGITSKTWGLNSSSSMKDLPEWVYVQGSQISATSGDVRVEARYMTTGGSVGAKDDLAITVMKLHLIPDFDHDRKIDGADAVLLETKGPYRFWINDDDDQEGAALDKSKSPHCPGVTRVNPTSLPPYVPLPQISIPPYPLDGKDDHVDGVSDFVDFFPVQLDIRDLLPIFPVTTWKYSLCQEGGSLKALLETDLMSDTVNKFLIDKEWTEGHANATVKTVTGNGCEIPISILSQIQNGSNYVILLEGAAESDKPLQLKVTNREKSGIHAVVANMPLKLSGVQKMFRCLNLRPILGDNRPILNLPLNPTGEPTNNPDSLSNGKNVVFIHGFNETPDSALGNISETFKRLYWSGSQAKFTGVEWFGDANYNAPIVGASTYYHLDVTNAFVTAPFFAQYLSMLQGEVNVISFSLGNMVVSSAIQDCQANPARYFMLHAAVAKEAYDPNGCTNAMIHVDWRSYTNRLFASKWNELFPAGDGRNSLTWSARFSSVAGVNTYNYFSSGEDVLYNVPGGDVTLAMLPGTIWHRRYAWCAQELHKGRWFNWAGGSSYGGWGFNGSYDVLDYVDLQGNVFFKHLPPDQASQIDPAQLKTNTFFNKSTPVSILCQEPDNPSGVGSQYATANRGRLLAQMIPALSFATGASAVGSMPTSHNINMQHRVVDGQLVDIGFQNGWPRTSSDWLHGDYKTVAYVYVSQMFDDIAKTKGNFNQ